MFIQAMNQLMWITFAPVTTSAAAYYKVTEMQIGLFSMVFMVLMIILSIPSIWVIDTYGFRTAVGIGAALTGVFGLVRGLGGSNYYIVLASQIGIAVGQPFILNAVAKVSARWFPMEERATASGLGLLAGFVGIIIGQVATPGLVDMVGFKEMLMLYGIISMASFLSFMAVAREKPQTPPCLEHEEERSTFTKGFKDIMRKKEYLIILFYFFVAMGAFNAVMTWIEMILAPRGITSGQAGIVGGVVVLSGILSNLIIPLLSDKSGKRIRFILLGVGFSLPGLLGMAYTDNFILILISAAVFGFFLLGTAPIAVQYATQVGYPTSEGTSGGLLMFAGNIAGVIFVYVMNLIKNPHTGSMTASLLGLTAALAVNFLLLLRLKEPANSSAVEEDCCAATGTR